MKPKFIINEEVLLTDSSIFNDENEHMYRVTCYDGQAIAVPTEDELESNPEAPVVLTMVYPKLSELTTKQKRECLEYRFGDSDAGRCTIEDVCIYMGKIRNPFELYIH